MDCHSIAIWDTQLFHFVPKLVSRHYIEGFLKVHKTTICCSTLLVPYLLYQMPKGDTMVNSRVLRPKTRLPFCSFSLIFCPSADSLLYHAPKKLAHEGVDHNSAVIRRVIGISTLKERNDHVGGPFFRKAIPDDPIENFLYVRGKELNSPF